MNSNISHENGLTNPFVSPYDIEMDKSEIPSDRFKIKVKKLLNNR